MSGPDDMASQELDLQQAHAKIRELTNALERKSQSVQTLNERLAIARAKHTNMAKILERKNATLQTLTDRNALLVETVRETRERLRNARLDSRAAAVASHNSAEGMDRFFLEHPENESYADFAHAVGALLAGHSLDLSGKSVFDVGVGPGYMLAHLLSSYTPSKVAGIDFSPVAIEIARRTIPSGLFHTASIYDLIEGHHEFVLCIEVLEHLERPDDALANVLSALAPGGIALLTTPDGRIDYSGLHINFWSPESWSLFVGRHAGMCDIICGQFQVLETAPYANNFAIIRRDA